MEKGNLKWFLNSFLLYAIFTKKRENKNCAYASFAAWFEALWRHEANWAPVRGGDGRGVAALRHICNFNCINMQKPQKMHKVLSPPTEAQKKERGKREKTLLTGWKINNLEAGKTAATNSFLKGVIGDGNEIIHLIWMRFSNWIDCRPRQTALKWFFGQSRIQFVVHQ